MSRSVMRQINLGHIPLHVPSDRVLRIADAAGALLASGLFFWSHDPFWKWSWAAYAMVSIVAALTNGTARVMRAVPGFLRGALVYLSFSRRLS